jgi:hypothetical protein
MEFAGVFPTDRYAQPDGKTEPNKMINKKARQEVFT